MLQVWVLAFAAGSDNLRAGVVLGLAGVSGRRRRLWFALAFGLVECVMPVLGFALGAAALAAADVAQIAAPTAIGSRAEQPHRHAGTDLLCRSTVTVSTPSNLRHHAHLSRDNNHQPEAATERS